MLQPGPERDRVARPIVDPAFAAPAAPGPGLPRSVHEQGLSRQRESRGPRVPRRMKRPVIHGDVHIDAGFRIDRLVEARVVVEVKAIENLLPIPRARRLAYPKSSGHRPGPLVNFSVRLMKNAIQRIVSST
jgi:GxxExxY protein